MASLSVVIITHNEASMIKGCLESVVWADEIIIVDDNSTDRTKVIAKKYTKKIYTRALDGFASQKNFAVSKATKDWILLLDADERVSGQLAQEIKDILKQKTSVAAFNIPFVNYFLGKRMNHGGWQHETHIRLFKKNKAKYVNQQIHEYLDIFGETGQLHFPIYHFSHRDISSNLLKTKQYAELEAHYHYTRHSPLVTKWSILKGLIKHFWWRYVQEKGYKDGMEGFVEAMYQAFSYIFIIQSMLWEKQRGKTSQQLYQELDITLIKNKFELTT